MWMNRNVKKDKTALPVTPKTANLKVMRRVWSYGVVSLVWLSQVVDTRNWKKRNQGASKFQPDHVLLVFSKWNENKIAPFTLEEKSFVSRGHVRYQYAVTM